MKFFPKLLFVFVFSLYTFSSCKSSKIILYYHDTSDIDDGEFFGDSGVSGFFSANKRVRIYKVKSHQVSSELKNIVSMLQQKGPDLEEDDGWYQYAFITTSHDTLYADHRVAYWKYKDAKGVFKSAYLKSDYLKAFVDSTAHPQ